MRILVLGSGTSTGVPFIGCPCPVCRSESPKNKRLRSSVFISVSGRNILIDTSTDLRQQALAHGLRRIDAVLFTHAHADHIRGIDELRSFNFLQKGRIPCYGNPETLSGIQRVSYYIFEKNTQTGGGIPKLDMFPVTGTFEAGGIEVRPIPVLHGRLEILGYRIGNMAYITDCSEFPSSSRPLVQGLDLLFINALRVDPHPTHFNLEKALEFIKSIRPQRAVLTHLSHQIDFHEDYHLPENVEFAYDGMTADLP